MTCQSFPAPLFGLQYKHTSYVGAFVCNLIMKTIRLFNFSEKDWNSKHVLGKIIVRAA